MDIFKQGDRVSVGKYTGVVSEIKDGEEYPVRVQFDDGHFRFLSYSKDGVYSVDEPKRILRHHHDLKTWLGYYHEVDIGAKTFDCRKNDRNFKQGDSVTLHQYDEILGAYVPGGKIMFTIGYILDLGQYGIAPGYVTFSLLDRR